MFAKKMINISTNRVEKRKTARLTGTPTFYTTPNRSRCLIIFQNSVREIVILNDGNTEEF